MQAVAALLLLLACLLPSVGADLARVDLAAPQLRWKLTNANNSVGLATTVPAHTLSVLASAGLVAADPLHRYGERDTRWVGEDTWNFTVVWPSKRHQALLGCRHVLLVLHGIDTFGSVILNGRRLLEADNAHRSWWLPLSEPDALREGANMLSVVLQPAAASAARAKALYPYPVPTMQVPGGISTYNFARKPAFDFGWDWGPAFVPAGLTGSVELVGFDRATLIGALVTQQFNSSSNTFDLTVTAHFVVPAGGDAGTLSLTLAVLDLHQHQQVELQPGVVGGNQLQALASMHLQVPADRVKLWQPLTLQPRNTPRQHYDLAVMFEPSVEHTPQQGGLPSTCGVAPAPSSTSTSSSSSSSSGDGPQHSPSGSRGPEPDIRSAIVRRIGFRTVELVQQPIQAAAQELLASSQPPAPAGQATGAPQQQEQQEQQQQEQQQEEEEQPEGESFFFRVNGVTVFAKGANLIPLHVLSTAVTQGDVRALLQSAVDANMNMVRIWGGGRYQVDALYDAADELGLMVWQEAMFACSPYPRDAAFLASVQAEVQQQLLRLGSHASLVVFGGNNEVEQSLDWYPETHWNLALYATDYNTLFVDTIGQLTQQMLPHTPWVDSSPSKGTILLPAAPSARHSTAQQEHGTAAGSSAGSVVKRWGNTNDPAFGDTHFYNYVDDCMDWRTYPHARFISEYGWQSYPSWSTYAAATAEQDWQLTADMTEFRQRHPNGTVELLAQLQRRFKLPEAWLELLPQPPTQDRPQPQAAAQVSPSSSYVAQAWEGGTQLASRALLAVSDSLSRLTPSSSSTSSSLSASHQADSQPQRRSNGLAVGAWSDLKQQQQWNDMQHFIYLTQLQQLLCYETALQHWRRLRSDPATLSMGVLYWQLNDVWAGASWSSLDQGGVWKPVHYGVARSFADLSLSVQHDLQEDTITVYAVSDLQQPVNVQLAVRLLSLTDTPAHCGSTAGSSKEGASQYAFAAAPYVRHHHMLQAAAPAGAAVWLWSQSVDTLLRKAGQACTRSSCYVHIALAGEGQPDQEHTVWLAPFSELPLQDPQVSLSGFQPAGKAAPAPAPAPAQPDRQAEADDNDASITFTVSSQRVAAYAVWETAGGAPAGHFSDNAVTVHPCEPRTVSFVPQGVARAPTEALVLQNSDVSKLLQEQVVVSSVWDHQQFDQQQQPEVTAVPS